MIMTHRLRHCSPSDDRFISDGWCSAVTKTSVKKKMFYVPLASQSYDTGRVSELLS